MKIRPILLTISLMLSLSNLFGQGYPKNYFHWPVDTPVIVLGVFGEIRDNHFHSGIDLSTYQMEGAPVKAAAEGYVSRIKISADGYGKALYITHPNGYVTVYGHLQKFTAALNEYVRKIQYERQKFEIDDNLKPNQFKIKQDEVIAYSGQTGGASGPHLHFEIRDEKSEEPINPLLFGLPLNDTQAPELKAVRIYPTPGSGIVNKTDTAMTYEIQTWDNVNMINSPNVILTYGYIGFGISAVDHQDGSTALLGIYSVDMTVDGQNAYHWQYDRFNFNDTKEVNAHIDYLTYVRDRLTVERAFRLPGNHLNIYEDSVKLGTQYFGEDASHDIKFIVKDFNGNQSFIEFPVVCYASLYNNPMQPKDPDGMLVTNSKGVAIHKSKLDVAIPAGAVYDDFWYTDFESNSPEYLANTYRIGSWYEALDVPITVGIKPEAVIPDSLKPKAIIAEVQQYGKLKGRGGKWNGKFLSADVPTFGDYTIVLDTTPPTVVKDYVPADMNSYRGAVIQYKITDNLSSIKSYTGMVDGKWILFEYDKKNDMLSADISFLPTNNEHKVVLTVIDERGNTTNYTSTFWF